MPKTIQRPLRHRQARAVDDATASKAAASPGKRRTEKSTLASTAAVAGVVIRTYGKFFDVQLVDDDRILLSTIKGTLKRERRRTDLIAVGDRVWVVDVGENEGQIEAVEPRVRVLARLARHT